MDTVHNWTGTQTAALRRALRMSVRDFAAHLGVAIRTVSKWEARGDSITLQPASQAMLDVVLNRASDDERTRFRNLAADHEAAVSEEPSSALKSPEVFIPLVVNGQIVMTPLSVDPIDGRAVFNAPANITEAPTSMRAVAEDAGQLWDRGGGDDMEIARRQALGVLAYGIATTAWGDAPQSRLDGGHRRRLQTGVVDRIRLAAMSYDHMAAEQLDLPLAEREAAVRQAELELPSRELRSRRSTASRPHQDRQRRRRRITQYAEVPQYDVCVSRQAVDEGRRGGTRLGVC